MKERLLMLLFVLVLGGILTTALVVVDDFTTPAIEKNRAVKLQSSVLGALGIEYEIESIETTFVQSVQSMASDDLTYYRANDGRLALPYVGSGLWGPITGILAMTEDLSTIDGITIMHQEETPGLGSRIAEDEYLEQFIDKKPANGLKMTQPGRASADDEIDSISGATMSSKAFIELLNSEYGVYRASLKEN